MVTLKDISKHIGVSVTQVSRALGGHSDVNAETRFKVEEAARLLGYRPNLMAKGLKTGKSGLIALVLPSFVDLSTRESMFELVMGMSKVISQNGMKFVLHVPQPDTDILASYKELYFGGGIDGFIVTHPWPNDERIAYLVDQKIPFLVHGRDPKIRHPFVDIDNYQVGYILGAHLIEKGHSNILFLNGPERSAFSQSRTQGFVQALINGGISNPESFVSYGNMTRDRATTEVKIRLTSSSRPSAILAGNTMLARGVYDVAKQQGLHIPQDLSVVAHDDEFASYARNTFEPLLTVTSSPMHLAWDVLGEELYRLIQNLDFSAHQTELSVSLSIAESS